MIMNQEMEIIKLTDSAIKEIKTLLEAQSEGEQFLRVGVKGGGCAGLSYIIEFDSKGDDDMVFDFEGIHVLVDKKHALYVSGMEVDYQHGLNDRGFIFNNPNATSTCGCGTSFSA